MEGPSPLHLVPPVAEPPFPEKKKSEEISVTNIAISVPVFRSVCGLESGSHGCVYPSSRMCVPSIGLKATLDSISRDP